MAVQYNFKDDSWSGIVKSIKDKTTGNLDISDKTKKDLETLKDLQGTTGATGDLKSLFSDIDEDFSKFLDKVDMSGDVFKQYQTHMEKNQESTSLFSRATKTAGTALKSFAATLGSMAAAWAIGEVFSLVATGIDSLLNQASNISEKAEGFASTMDTFNSSVKEGSSQIDDLANKYEKLSEGVDNSGNNVSLTAEQYSEYKDTVSKLSDIMPDHISLLNAQGEKIGFVGGKLKDVNKEYREYLKNQATSLLNDEDENGNSYKDTLDDYDIQSATASSGRQGVGYDARQLLNSAWVDLIPESTRKTFLNGWYNQDSLWNEIFGTEDTYTTQEKIDVLNKLKGKQKKDWRTILGDTDYGDSKKANIVEDALDIDVDKLDEYTDDQLSQLLKTKIDSFQNQLDTKANNIAKGVSAMLVNDDDFDGLDESLQNNISTLVSSMNADVLNGLRDNGVDVNDQLKLNTWINTFVDTIKSNKDGVVSTKTLQGMPDGLRNLEGYTDFRNTVSSSKVSKGDKKKAFEDLVSEYIDTNATIKGVTNETRYYVINALNEIENITTESITRHTPKKLATGVGIFRGGRLKRKNFQNMGFKCVGMRCLYMRKHRHPYRYAPN